MSSIITVPRDDELLWSVAARFCRLFPNRASRALVRTHFLQCDNEVRRIGMDFPTRLNEIAQSFPSCLKTSGVGLAVGHTMLPLVAPFAEHEDYASLLDAMRETGIAGYAAGRWAWALGVEPSTPLRFCPVCRREDVARWGTAHWRRIHQVPELTSCAVHRRVRLVDTMVTRSTREYIALDAVPVTVEVEHEPDDLQCAFMQDLSWLFSAPMLWVGGERIRAALIEVAGKRLGFLPTLLGIEKWAVSLQERFGAEALLKAKKDLGEFRTGWLADILTTKGRILPVTSAIVVAAWAGVTLEELVTKAAYLGKEEKGPWPCVNEKAACFGKLTIKRWRRATDDISHRFACPDCGMSYVRPHPLATNGDGSFDFRIVRDPGYWAVNLEKEWMKPEHTLVSLGRLYGKSAVTIGLRAARLGLPDVGHRKLDRFRRIKPIDTESKRTRLRDQWLEIFRSQGNVILRALPMPLKRVGYWLSQNDREWYRHNTPIAYRPRGHAKDWNAIDAATEERLREMEGELIGLRVNRTRRVAPRTILNEIRPRLDIKWHTLPRMPRTKAFLEKLAESPREFARRRIVEVVRAATAPIRWRSTLAAEAGAGSSSQRDPVVRIWVNQAFEFLRDRPASEYPTFDLGD